MRGLFIVFEGLDRSGKSSQVRVLSEYLSQQGHKTRVIRFPARDSGPIGSMIDAYLSNKSMQMSDQSIHLLFSANRWELREQIISDLNSGVTVICDRYIYSGVVYSATKGLQLDWCKAADHGLPLPDLVLFLAVSPEVAKSRGDFGAERYENVVFQEGVRKHFEHFSTLKYWRVIDANGAFETVTAEIRRLVLDQINDVPRGAVEEWRGD